MWRSYFGPGLLHYYGVDINFLCEEVFGSMINVDIALGDQANRTFWQEYKLTRPEFDIVIDDGGHSMEQQIVTFEELYSHVKPGGVYLIEDLATSYDEFDASFTFGGGYKNPGTLAEYMKDMIDHVNGHYIHSAGDAFPSNITQSTVGVSFYDQMVILEKGQHAKPTSITAGTLKLPYGLGVNGRIPKEEQIDASTRQQFAEFLVKHV